LPIEFVDEDGDSIRFEQHCTGRLQFFANDKLQVESVTEFRVNGRTLHFHGRQTVIPRGQEKATMRVMMMFHGSTGEWPNGFEEVDYYY